MTVTMTVVERIRALDAQGMPATQIATRVGVHRDTVAKYTGIDNFSPRRTLADVAVPKMRRCDAASRHPCADAVRSSVSPREAWDALPADHLGTVSNHRRAVSSAGEGNSELRECSHAVHGRRRGCRHQRLPSLRTAAYMAAPTRHDHSSPRSSSHACLIPHSQTTTAHHNASPRPIPD